MIFNLRPSSGTNLLRASILLAALCVAQCAIITDILPRYGSVQGGTLLTIRGEGFNRGGMQGTTSVLLGNFPCTVVEYWSSDTQLVCYTPAMAPKSSSNVRIDVFLLSITDGKSGSAGCRTDCSFNYRWDRTPYVTSLPSGVSTLGVLAVSGYHLSDNAQVYEVMIGDQWCDVDDSLFDPNPSVNWGWGSVRCLVPNQPAGLYNISFAHQDPAGYGLAALTRSATRATFENQTYNLVLYPTVTSLSATTGSILGGDTITVTGAGFDPIAANNKVLFGGIPCAISSSTSTQLICEPGPSPSDTTLSTTNLIPGSRGLLRKVWNGVWLGFGDRNAKFPTTAPSVVSSVTNGLSVSSSNNLDNFVEELSGVFVPPRTGKFSFYMSADDWAALALDQGTGFEEIATVTTAIGDTFYAQPNQISQVLTLNGGQAYPIRVRHQEYGGADFLRVAIREIDVPNMSDNQRLYQSVLPLQSVSITTTVVREQHQFWLDNVLNGTFRFQVTKQLSASVAWTDMSNMRNALAEMYQNAGLCSSITLSSPVIVGTKYTWTITFGCPHKGNYPVLEVVNVGLRGPNAARPSFGSSQTLTASTPLSGKFKLAWSGQQTTELDIAADGTTIEAALESLTGVRQVTVGVSGNALDNRAFSIQFVDPYGAQPSVTVVSVSLDGSDVAFTTTVRESGNANDIFSDPMPSEYLRFATALPPIDVTTNGIRATCQKEFEASAANVTDCSYVYQDSLAPTVTSITLVSPKVAGQIAKGERLNIVGAGFDPIPENNFVRLGAGGGCQVTAATATTLTCVVVSGVAGPQVPEVIVYGIGKGKNAAAIGQITIRRSYASVTPNAGSIGGGANVTIVGSGFPTDSAPSVKLGSVDCAVVSFSNDQIVVTIPAGSGESSQSFQIMSETAGTLVYAYRQSLTPAVTSIQPTQFSAGLSTLITLTGSFPTASSYNVSIAGSACIIRGQVSSTQLTCMFRRLKTPPPQGQTYAPVVSAGSLGVATVAASVRADVALRVTSITPTSGSFAGGATVTINGAGFATQFSYESTYLYMFYNVAGRVELQRTRCEPFSYTFNQVICKTYGQPPPLPTSGDTVTTFDVRISNVSAICVGGASVCKYTFADSLTPYVTSITPNSGFGGDTVTIVGRNLATANPIATIGGAPCVVTSSSATSIVCTAPASPTGVGNVLLKYETVGNAAVADNTLFTFGLRVDSLSAQFGSQLGGSFVTMTGKGFSNKATIVFGSSVSAFIVSATADQIVFITPSSSIASQFSVAVSQNQTRQIGKRDLSYSDILPGFQNPFEADTSYLPIATALGTSCTNPDSCSFTFSTLPQFTSQITAITPSSGSTVASGQVITITGSGFVTAQNRSSVTFGGVPCAISAWSDISITCTLGSTPAGVYPVLVFVDGKGLADHRGSGFTLPNRPFSLSVAVTVTSITPAVSSFAGGEIVTIAGSGFSATNTTVQICNSACFISTVTATSIVCTTPPIVTDLSASSFYTATPSAMVGKAFGKGWANNIAFAFDGNVETNLNMDAIGCSVGFELPVGSAGKLTQIRFYSVFQQTARFLGGKFEVSVDGITYYTVYTQLTTPLSGWTEATPNLSGLPDDASRQNVRFFRYSGVDGTRCWMGELQFVGITTAAGVSQTGDAQCAVGVDVAVTATRFPLRDATVAPVVSQVASTNIAYQSAVTGVVSSITPSFGTALGGTVVTIAGSNLGSASSVLLNGYSCKINSNTANAIVCSTGARGAIIPPSVIVVTASGYAAVPPLVAYRYLDRWSALTTWLYNEPPVEGDTVVIPEGQAVLLDESPPILKLLYIQGELIFDRQDGLHLQAIYIVVHGGNMEIGTEAQPFLNKATVTLHGDKFTDVELPTVGSKVLTVMNRNRGVLGPGELNIPQTTFFQPSANLPGIRQLPTTLRGNLDLHGAPRKRVWTFVAQTALAGSNVIVAAEDVDYKAGEKLVLTSGDSDYTHAEEVVVQSLGADSRTITITVPLQYDHVSEIRTVEGRRVDLRVQIGLLSRNIVIQGAPGKSEAQNYGSHIMCAHMAMMRVENIETTRCGQSGNKGRYCIHWHMSGAQPNAYARSNSVHHSFQRAITIHGTNYLRVQRNFAYLVKGHTIFVEDGGEIENVIEENLIASTLRLYNMKRSDTKPASFWTASPRNYWRHNVAAGCQNDGYWLELPGAPEGPSAFMPYCPSSEPLGEHYNNTAHSNGVHGLRIYPVYLPAKVPCDQSQGPAAQYLQGFNSWRNGNNGIFGRRNGDIHHLTPTLTENGQEQHNWNRYLTTVFTNDPNVKDGLYIGSLDPTKPKRGSPGLLAPQNEYWFADGITFVNFADGAIEGCSGCSDQTSLRQGGYTYRFKNLKFVNSPKRVIYSWPFKDIHWDLDGSLTGTADSFLTPYRAWLEDPQCKPQGAEVYSNGTICSGVAVRRLQIDEVEPRELDWRPLMIKGQNAKVFGTVDFFIKEIYGWVVPVLANRAISIDFYNPSTKARHLVDWRTMRIRYSEPDYVKLGEWQRLTWLHFDFRYQYRVSYGGQGSRPWLTEGSTPDLTNDFGTGAMGAAYVNGAPGDKSWSVVITTNNLTATGYPTGDWGKGQVETASDSLTMRIGALQCAPGMATCSLPNDIPLGDMKMWSDAATWPSGIVPVESEDVEIPPGLYVVMDVSPPKLGAVKVYGKLEFQDGTDKTLLCDSIIVSGTLQIGSPRFPFSKKATIKLHGDRQSPTVIVDDSLFLGNKMIVVLGRMEFYGKPIATTWTRLAATAAVGTSTLSLLAPAVDWAEGDVIALGNTDYVQSHVEYLTISSMSKDGLTVTTTTPLQYTHFGQEVNFGTKSANLMAAVGHVTRNIVITADIPNSDGYGGHVVVADLPDKGKKGSVLLRYTQFEGTGKLSMEHASIFFKYFGKYTSANYPNNVVEGCGFSNSFNYGVNGEGAQGIVLTRNVFSKAFRSCIDLDQYSTDVKLTGNLIMNVAQPPDETTNWIRPIAGIFIQSPPKVLKDNYVAGSYDFGYVIRPPSCDALNNAAAGNDSTIMEGNEAVGCRIGIQILPGGNYNKCSMINGFTGWKNTHMGLNSVDQDSDLILQDIVLTDNHIDMSLRFFYSNSNAKITLENAVISGNSAATDCSEQQDCRAFGPIDGVGATCGSVLSGTWGRVGILLPQFGNRGKTCERDDLPVCRPPNTPERLCGMGWERRYGLPPTVYARFDVIDTVFANFQPTGCGLKQVAMRINPTQPDYTPATYTSSIQWVNTDKDAQVDLSKSSSNWPACQDGGCDAIMNFFIKDTDGTFTQTTSPTAVVPNQLLSEASGACYEKASFDSSICSLDFAQGTLESYDEDRGSRRMGPVHLDRMEAGSSTNVVSTSIAIGPLDDSCAKRFHFGQFPLVFVANREYNIVTSGVMPTSSGIWYHEDDPKKSVKVSIFYSRPTTLVVFAGNKRLESLGRVPLLSDPAGSYVQDPQARLLHLVMRGGTRQYTIRSLPLVQLSMSLAVTPNEFYSDRVIEHLSQLLSIDPSTIKVVNVRAGSTIVDVEIIPAFPVSNNETVYLDQVKQMQSVAKEIVTLAQDGSYNVGYTVLKMEVVPPVASASQNTEDFGIPAGSFVPLVLDDSSKGLSSGAIAGIVIAGMAFMSALVAFYIYHRRSYRASFSVEGIENAEMHRGHADVDEEQGLAVRAMPHQSDRKDDWEDDDNVVGVVRQKGAKKAAPKPAKVAVEDEIELGTVSSTEDIKTAVQTAARRLSKMDDYGRIQ